MQHSWCLIRSWLRGAGLRIATATFMIEIYNLFAQGKQYALDGANCFGSDQRRHSGKNRTHGSGTAPPVATTRGPLAQDLPQSPARPLAQQEGPRLSLAAPAGHATKRRYYGRSRPHPHGAPTGRCFRTPSHVLWCTYMYVGAGRATRSLSARGPNNKSATAHNLHTTPP